MVITTLGWIALGLMGVGAVAAIIAYWDKLVKWATDLLESVFDRGKMFLRWVNGTLESWVSGIVNGKAETHPGPPQPATEEEIRRLCEEGIISYSEMINLLNGKTVSASANIQRC